MRRIRIVWIWCRKPLLSCAVMWPFKEVHILSDEVVIETGGYRRRLFVNPVSGFSRFLSGKLRIIEFRWQKCCGKRYQEERKPRTSSPFYLCHEMFEVISKRSRCGFITGPLNNNFLIRWKVFFSVLLNYVSRGYFIWWSKKERGRDFLMQWYFNWMLYFKLSYLDYFAWGKGNDNDEFSSSTSGA